MMPILRPLTRATHTLSPIFLLSQGQAAPNSLQHRPPHPQLVVFRNNNLAVKGYISCSYFWKGMGKTCIPFYIYQYSGNWMFGMAFCFIIVMCSQCSFEQSQKSEKSSAKSRRDWSESVCHCMYGKVTHIGKELSSFCLVINVRVPEDSGIMNTSRPSNNDVCETT